MHEKAVEINNLSFTYAGAREPTLRDINLVFYKGQISMLIGPTGAGKSTFYMCLNGLIPNLIRGRMSGGVVIAGLKTSEHSIPELAQKVGIVFQNPEIQMFSLTVKEELAFGPENLGLPKEEILERVDEAVRTIRLEELLEREPARLSGGQQQTVAIGSIWSMLPEVLILDEPTSDLDPASSLRVLNLIRRLNRDYGKTILIAEHKIDEVARFADRVFVMHHGQILLEGTPREVFSQVETLHKIGLAAPAPTELAYRLKLKGLPIESLPLTVEECVEVLGKKINKINSHNTK